MNGNPDEPQITSGAVWTNKPPFCVNLGLTFEGLKALGLPQNSLASFPPEFSDLTEGRAAALGDVGESAPETWLPGLAWADGRPPAAHLLLFLFAQNQFALDQASADLRAMFTAGGALTELHVIDGAELPESRVHFGYVDGLSQPHIAGTAQADPLDDDPPAATGEFLLGYPNQNRMLYPVPSPPALGHNGAYAAVRILKQDVDAFEAFLDANAAQMPALPNVDPKELLAAKVCGRWRNGVPLALSPETDAPDPPLTLAQLNHFDYAPSPDFPDALDDHHGFRCPLGAHMRRSHPRNGPVAGGSAGLHRVLRRGIPYGPVYDPAHPHDGQERGLFGMFLCASLQDQFEFIMREWINGDSFGLSGDLDALSGNNQPGQSRFQIPLEASPHAPIHLTGFGRFVSTRGSAYCFLPSLTALKFLASL